MKISLAFLIIALALLLQPVSANEIFQSYEKQLKEISIKLDQRRKAHHVPGLAIAIVKDNKVIFSKGYGVSDIDKNTPVTDHTMFGIGSTTKAFTANLIAMLVDDGILNWDDPVTKHLPHLQFNLKKSEDQITLRDMMSHQTGFTRFNLLYANGEVKRNDILNAATKAEPWAEFREKFLYTNLMVTGAGVAAAQSVNTDWESLLESRLLDPLGMKNTTARFKTVQENPLLSSGYMWLEEQNKHKKLRMHNITNIGPAGSINSNAVDMTKWLKLQLNKGNFDGNQIVSTTQIEETWSPQIKVGNGASYGLGWIMRDLQGQKMVVHDGSVEGYSAIVALLPETNLGFVLLTNLTQTPLLAESISLVFGTLLDTKQDDMEEEVKQSSSKTADFYGKYIGKYMANFASFENTLFDFHVENGIPYLNVPGQSDYELLPPDENGLMFFKVTNTVSVSFDKNEKGDVSALRMQQNGMNFELQKQGVPITVEINEQALQKYLGQYKSELFKGNLTVAIQNKRLAVNIPGQMTFELHLPDEKNRRHFRIKNDMSVEFEINTNNEVVAMSAYNLDKKIDTATKVVDINTELLPTISEILTLRKTKQRIKSLKNAGGIRLTGKVTMKQSGLKGQMITSFVGYDQFREEIDFGQYGSIITALNEKSAAIAPSFAAFLEQHGKYFSQAKYSHPSALIDWHHYYDQIDVLSTTEFNGSKAFVIKLSGGKASDIQLIIDAKNGDILKQESTMLNPTLGSIPVITTYENYQEKFGLRIPFKINVKNEFNGESEIELVQIESNLEFTPSLFKLNNPETGE
ncbi:MAG: serine hydrolase domain-containing protein [Marinicellaceae bacterium]